MAAEPVSIFMTVTGILTFFRNTFRALQEDATEWRNYEDWNEDRSRVLIHLRDEIESWQKRWMIWAEHDELYRIFWGNQSSIILDDLKKLLMRVEKFDDIIKRCKRRGKKCYRTLVVHKGTQLDRALDKIDKRFKTLTLTSNTIFMKQVDRVTATDNPATDNPNDPSTMRIHKIGLQKLLLDLALTTYSVTGQLCHRVQQSYIPLAMEIEINLFCPDLRATDNLIMGNNDQLPNTNFTTRSQGIAISALNKAIHSTFLVRRSYETLWLRLRTTQTPDIDTFKDPHPTYQDFERLVQFITDGHLNFRCGLYLSPQTGVVVRREVTTLNNDVPDSRPLREVLITDPPNNHEGFRRIKARRAFQLAEFGLFFFTTTWMNLICSCNIRQMRVNTNFTHGVARVDECYRLTLRIPVENNPENDPQNQPCWCSAKRQEQVNDSNLSRFDEEPLFFLGLVLIEVVLSAPLLSITITDADPQMETVNITYRSPTGNQTSTLIGLRERLRSDNVAFYDAIELCITSRWTAENARRENLEEYYRRVLYP